jgi:outer membrane protein OmpA-like peptidoglycan-associated protein
MTTSAPAEQRGPRRRRRFVAAEGAEKLDQLRHLLVGPEQTRLTEVEKHVAPEAVVASIRDAIQNDPRLFVDAIAPVMGPAIRKAVSQALRSLVQQLNETLARGLSPRALMWRFEAMRTGRPFAEVVLLRSLLYRVEQVFLVHAETGLVLKHLILPGAPSQDPDQVAAMLSAIDTFVHDAFREDARLARFQVGELSGWVEHGPRAVLVAVVRGNAPSNLGELLREVEERIHLEFPRELAAFRGDVTPFDRAEPILERCLLTETAEVAPGGRSRAYAFVAFGLVALLCGLLVAWHLRSERREARILDGYSGALAAEPGLILTKSERDGGRYTFEGLRDPLAADPAVLLAARGLPADRASYRFASFYSLDPRIAERRAQTDYDTDAATRLRERADAIAERQLLFPVGKLDVRSDQDAELRELTADVVALAELAKVASIDLTIDVIGHADASGAESQNQALSLARAERVVAMLSDELSRRGLDTNVFHAGGAGAVDFPPTRGCVRDRHHGADCARSVSFRVRARSHSWRP